MNLETILQTIDENCCLDLPDSALADALQHQSILLSNGDYCCEEHFGENV